MKLHEHSQAVVQWILPVSISIIPLFFLPITENYYETNKWLLILIVALVSIVAWTIKSVRTSKCSFSITPATIALGALTATSLVTFIFMSTNKVEALLSPYGLVTFLALSILMVFLPTLEPASLSSHLKRSLYVVTGIVGLIAIYQSLGVGKTIFAATPFLTDPQWTPTGSTIATASLLIITLPMILSDVFHTWKKGFDTNLGFLIIIALASLGGVGFTVWQYILHAGNALPLKDAWTITLEVLKNPLPAFFGVGSENYLTAFSIGRPQTLNMTALWNIRFTTSASTFLHIITTNGLTGGLAFLLLVRSLIMTKNRDAAWISRILCVLALCFTPPTLTIIIMTALALLLEAKQDQEYGFKIPGRNNVLRVVTGVVMVIILGSVLWPLSQAYGSELLYDQAILSAQKNNGSGTYTFLSQAIKKNPQVSRYHIAFSQTSLAIANAMAGSVKTANPKTDAEKKTLANNQQIETQLIQQAIDEGKIATSLNSLNVLGWENIANLYAQLINVAQGSDSWAISAYKQVISLDPTNPVFRLQLGSIYYQEKQYSNAILQFQLAIGLKSNYANAYYNLAETYKMNNNITQAIDNMQQAQALVDKKSDDYRITTNELTSLKAMQPGNPTTTQTQETPLVTPTPATRPLSPAQSLTPPTNTGHSTQK